MSKTYTLQIGQRGVLTIPKSVREAYKMQPGDPITLLDLGGVFVLSPRLSEIDDLSARITESLVEKGQDLESMLKVLREQRERYGDQDPDLS
ncbi:MAG: AbrB/MazE/SpoVT family DNA-binding domain-containing protein [Chloroflexi bacterium]|nr:AbrB/MazE/SpoVT family DNA-binding domain-containing protein [Chloroflexota bacterium]MCH8875221.1 AbrB/MazE/SpoVT family DNA-binding domain-containing protein [Chloroflexota bacterium]MCI0773921.1 AbrB/MazE/SpoVT family DNA-binding domain-containing protein [Chloroflexota bacterium]MCI0806971.1 AbrB/MazE/SpoVT family DNA-binding domain-containing protein [Chloroflexota bacterium]MCI0827844.1 AbrB/MazE/SpoVT family DNA-binding domain-containing protein [Chloroflexota bacterium]